MKIIKFQLTQKTRSGIRQEVISKWLTESPGSLDGPVKYRYNVEKLKNGTRIYLLRPAGLNKGCDFVIVCEEFLKFKNGKDKPPRHKDLIIELGKILKKFPKKRTAILRAISNIWDCQSPDEVLVTLPKELTASLEMERILKIMRWMFIEQDVTYWAHSGRSMLRNALEEEFGKLIER